MTSLFTADSLISLITLALLEIVLGIDNVIFVSILMGRLDKEKNCCHAEYGWSLASQLELSF
jgi:predicted tellurium resistance membrane protein TerC